MKKLIILQIEVILPAEILLNHILSLLEKKLANQQLTMLWEISWAINILKQHIKTIFYRIIMVSFFAYLLLKQSIGY